MTAPKTVGIDQRGLHGGCIDGLGGGGEVDIDGLGVAAAGAGDSNRAELAVAAGRPITVNFTPHLMPMDRGILCTMYARPTTDVSEDDLLDAMRSFYEGKPFVRIVEHLPSTKDVTHTNFCDITVRKSRGQVIIMSCTDNLIKGAAGVAVQNFNLMCGFEETTGLLL